MITKSRKKIKAEDEKAISKLIEEHDVLKGKKEEIQNLFAKIWSHSKWLAVAKACSVEKVAEGMNDIFACCDRHKERAPCEQGLQSIREALHKARASINNEEAFSSLLKYIKSQTYHRSVARHAVIVTSITVLTAVVFIAALCYSSKLPCPKMWAELKARSPKAFMWLKRWFQKRGVSFAAVGEATSKLKRIIRDGASALPGMGVKADSTVGKVLVNIGTLAKQIAGRGIGALLVAPGMAIRAIPRIVSGVASLQGALTTMSSVSQMIVPILSLLGVFGTAKGVGSLGLGGGDMSDDEEDDEEEAENRPTKRTRTERDGIDSSAEDGEDEEED